MAPEIIKGTPYGPEVDMWAIGIITYVLLCGYPTFDGKTELEVMANITAVNYEFPSPDWDYVSDDAKDFIDKILQANPHDRMTAEASLQHNWIVKKGYYPEYYEDYDEEYDEEYDENKGEGKVKKSEENSQEKK